MQRYVLFACILFFPLFDPINFSFYPCISTTNTKSRDVFVRKVVGFLCWLGFSVILLEKSNGEVVFLICHKRKFSNHLPWTDTQQDNARHLCSPCMRMAFFCMLRYLDIKVKRKYCTKIKKPKESLHIPHGTSLMSVTTLKRKIYSLVWRKMS